MPPGEANALATVGDVIDGKYRVERILGSGGMGIVVAARHLRLDEVVAIKMMLPAALANAQAVQRFEREARAAVKIKSPHVARIHDVSSLPSGGSYIVMECLEGHDLSAELLRNGPLSGEAAADAVIEACDALCAAHAIGIIHRDLKPANLFSARQSDGSSIVKVLDFGISKASLDKQSIATQSVVGTPYYMSPEQLETPGDLDARSDIWSLGVVLFELLTGRIPFDGETLPELVLAVVMKPPHSVAVLRPGLPPGLCAIVERCLTKDRKGRFSSAAELALALAPFGSRKTRAIVDRMSRPDDMRALAPMGARTQPIAPDRLSQTPPRATTPLRISAPPLQQTPSAWQHDEIVVPGVSRGRIAIFAALGALMFACAVTGAFLVNRAHVAHAPASSSTPEAASPVPPPSPVESGAPPAESAVVETPPAASSSAVVAKPSARPLAAPPPQPAPAAAPRPAAPNCNPPYTFGPDGTKNFKRECL